MPLHITLPDGTQKNFDDPRTTAHDVARSIGEGLAEAAIGARVDGELYDVHRPLPGDCALALITAPRLDKKGRSKWRDEQHEKDALYLLRHSTAHVMAEAIERLYPGVQLAYGPPLDTGFYYDMKLDTPISSDDFPTIQAEMQKIVSENRAFSRYELDIDTGMSKLYDEGNKYKIDNAGKATARGATALSWYVTGRSSRGIDPWSAEPLLTAPTVETGKTSAKARTSTTPPASCPAAFKIMSVASSNWHGDVNSDRFQRVYGTAFFSAADLEAHLDNLEQAKARDHRVIGRALGLFEIDEMVGQGLVLWKPKGAVVRDQLQKFISEHLERQGYSQVFTPHIGKLDLYRTSGHFPYYADSQYPPLIERELIKKLADDGCTCADLSASMNSGDIEGYMLKPMNCPHHIRIFASDKHSYRDLPVRLAEFGTVYRWEQSGELGGMTRVRGFTQDDAHLFVTPEQLAYEVLGCIELVKIVFATLGMDDYRGPGRSARPRHQQIRRRGPRLGRRRGGLCRRRRDRSTCRFTKESGEAAFYGPKIDFVVKDVIGREWQLGTVQVDYQLPQRFEPEYTRADNTEKTPIMIHRAPFGSMERFIGCLIEHFNGAFPLVAQPRAGPRAADQRQVQRLRPGRPG